METPIGTVVPRPDGRGALKVGNPGNAGGGRPKDRVRALAAGGGEIAVKKIIALLESGDELSPTDLKGCCDVLLKYGIGTQQEVEFIKCDQEAWKIVLEGLKEGAKAKGIEKEMDEILGSIEIPDEWMK